MVESNIFITGYMAVEFHEESIFSGLSDIFIIFIIYMQKNAEKRIASMTIG